MSAHIGRPTQLYVRDTSNFKSPDLNPFHQFPAHRAIENTVGQKRNSEQEPQTKVLFGAHNWPYFIVSLLTVWFKHYFRLTQNKNELCSEYKGMTNSDSTKTTLAYHLNIYIIHTHMHIYIYTGTVLYMGKRNLR